MQRPVVFIAVLLFSIFLLNTAFAGGKKHLPAKIKADSSKVEVKKFNSQAIEKFKKDKDFNYDEGKSYNLSIWARFGAWIWYILNWLWEHLTGWLTAIPYSGGFFRYFLLVVAIGGLVFFILKAIGIDLVKLLQGKSKKIDIPFTESIENIHDINFDTEIEKAISLHNYRLAVRLLYLKCLKQLSDSNLIHWKIDKTNTAYLFELTDTAQKQTFRLLTRQFEYIWYGDFPIDKQAFGHIYQLFQDFKKQLP